MRGVSFMAGATVLGLAGAAAPAAPAAARTPAASYGLSVVGNANHRHPVAGEPRYCAGR
jgi:hypothetical protein